MKTIISIEGNIGSGKSTLINLLKEKHGDKIAIIEEPIEEWIKGDNLLNLFYKCPLLYAYQFQNLVLKTMIEAITKEIENGDKKIIVCDRSYISASETFASVLHDEGILTDEEYYKLKHFTKYTNICTQHIYLRTSPETCFNRIQKRARKEENKVSLTYLKSIHEKHDIWLNNKLHIILDGEKDFINNEDIKEDYINKILSLTRK